MIANKALCSRRVRGGDGHMLIFGRSLVDCVDVCACVWIVPCESLHQLTARWQSTSADSLYKAQPYQARAMLIFVERLGDLSCV